MEPATAQALVKALGELPTITKDREANTGKFSYRYADLATILGTIRPILASHGFALMQTPTVSDDGRQAGAHSLLLHESGDVAAETTLLMPVAQEGAQAVGSAITYARRYSLAMLGVVTEEDDDGAAAQPSQPTPKPKQERGPVLAKGGISQVGRRAFWDRLGEACGDDHDLKTEAAAAIARHLGIGSVADVQTVAEFDEAMALAADYPDSLMIQEEGA